MCGNGLRVFLRYLEEEGLVVGTEVTVATRAGLRTGRFLPDGRVAVTMGRARIGAQVQVRLGADTWPATAVDVGNPHAVAFVDDLDDAGRLLDPPTVTPTATFPEGVNVEFVVERGPAHVAFRVFERGVGETRSCGTGACAVLAAARQRPGADPSDRWTVDVPGGRLTLTVGADGDIAMTGPAVLVAEGEIRREWWEAHR
jgi:diaminopimelate epimerase